MKKPPKLSHPKQQSPWNTVIHTPCIPLECTLFKQAGIQVWCKLDYLNHPAIQGNKWHKLRANLNTAIDQQACGLLTFGGAFSNHIAATAAAAKAANLPSIGVIRGDELANTPSQWSQTLKTAAQNGMQLIFVSRADYRLKENAHPIQTLLQANPKLFVIPEGGTNLNALQGFDHLAKQINHDVPDWTHIFCPVGTGGTLAGLSANLRQLAETLPDGKPANIQRKILGIAVLKKAEYLKDEIQNLIQAFELKNKNKNKIINELSWELLTQYHCGGYAKVPNDLERFQRIFEHFFKIPIDPIYNAKMLYGIYQEVKKGNIPAGSKVVILHTGGLQGRKPKPSYTFL